MRTCPQCQKAVDEDALFCDMCGCKLEPMQEENSSEIEESTKEECKYCPECGTKNLSTSDYCLSCGKALTVQSKTKEKTQPNKQNKKIFLVAGLLLVLVAVVFLITKGNNTTFVEVKGKKYTFSAENGIDNYQKINDGVVYISGLYNYKYKAIGSTQEVDVNKDDYTAYLNNMSGNFNVDDQLIFSRSFVFTDDFKTMEGVSEESNVSKMKNAGYILVYDAYLQFATEHGNLDWEIIEQEYEQAKQDGHFQNLPYYHTFKSVLPDSLRVSENFADVEAKLSYSSNAEESKAVLMYWMACGKLCDSYVKGEIDYFCCSRIYPGEQNVLDIQVYTDRENVIEWMTNWGFPSN